jgi:hypothetical protein
MERKITTTLLLIFCSLIAVAQPSIEWQVSLGGTLRDELDEGNSIYNNVILTSDAGVAFAGASWSNDGDVTGHHGLQTTSDMWCGKLDSLGGLEWQKSLGGTGDDRARGLCQTADGGYAIIGDSGSDDGDVTGHIGSADTIDVWVVKLDDQGNIQWERSYGGTGLDSGVDIKQTENGDFVLGSDTWSFNGDVSQNKGSSDFWFTRVDSAGVIQWERSFGGSSSDRLRAFQLAPDGGIIAIGLTTSDDGDITFNTSTILPAIWVIKIDSIGNKEWDKCFSGIGFSLNQGNDIQNTPDGGFILNSYTNATNGNIACTNGTAESWVAKLDDTGNVEWSHCYGGPGVEFGKTVRLTPDGGYLISSSTDGAGGLVSNHIGGTDCWIVKTDSLGNVEWDGTYGGTEAEVLTTAIPAPDGGYILGAESGSNDVDVSGHHGALGDNDIWIVKLAPLSVGVDEPADAVTSISVYPNPTEGQMQLSIELFDKGLVQIELLDIRGRVVKKISSKEFNAGTHQLHVNTKDIDNGMYLVKLSTTKNIQTTRVMKN